MFRHSVRHVVKAGEFNDFLEAFRALNAAAAGAGVPSYKLWRTVFGDLNEIWSEADYDSLDGHVQAWAKAASNEELMNAFRQMVTHTVPGSVHDYPLEPIEL